MDLITFICTEMVLLRLDSWQITGNQVMDSLGHIQASVSGVNGYSVTYTCIYIIIQTVMHITVPKWCGETVGWTCEL